MPDPDALPGPARLSRLPPTAVSIRHTVLRTLAHTNWRLALPALALTCGSLIVQAASSRTAEDRRIRFMARSPAVRRGAGKRGR